MNTEIIEKTRKRPARLAKMDRSSAVKGGPITQKDLARLAGVSMTTIYNSLHAKELVHPETRELIDRLMEEYDYQPNGIARAMVRGKTEVLGILVPRIDVRFYSEIVAAIEQSVNHSGYSCIICQHLDDVLKEEREIRMMRERRVDGMIIRASGRREQAEMYHQLDRAGIPFVLVDRTIPGLEDRFVGADGLNDSCEITEYLIRKGHKRIAVTVWPESSQKLGVKYDGYRLALERHGIEFDERLVMMCSTEYFAGREETLDMMRRVGPDKPTAILSLNDTSILGVIQGLLELGMSIPDDVAVTNIGGHISDSLGALSRLRLTCSVTPCETIGREAARMLSSQIDGESWRRGPILCPSQIRVGNSA
jgi:LacI family transcriptional regulator